MAYFAVIQGSFVVNTIVADTKEDAENATRSKCIEYKREDPVGIGWTYDEENGIFIEPQQISE